MPKPRRRPRHRQSPLPEHPQHLPPRLPTQRHRHPSIHQQVQLGFQPPPALRALLRRRPIRRRRAPHDRRHIRPTQLQPITPMPALPLVRKPRAMQRPKQEVTRPIPRKHPPGPVPPMRRRRQSNQQHPCRRIPKPGNRPTPIRLISVRRPLRPRRLFPPGHQPRTAATAMNLSRQFRQFAHAAAAERVTRSRNGRASASNSSGRSSCTR